MSDVLSSRKKRGRTSGRIKLLKPLFTTTPIPHAVWSKNSAERKSLGCQRLSMTKPIASQPIDKRFCVTDAVLLCVRQQT